MSTFSYKNLRLPTLAPSIRAEMQTVRSKILQEVKLAIQSSGLSPRARRSISQYLKLRVDAKSVQMEITKPEVLYLLRGRRETAMNWLSKARRPIPIDTPQGVIFRVPSHKTLADGKWVHPGVKPSDLLSRIRERVHPILRERVRRSLRQTILKAIR